MNKPLMLLGILITLFSLQPDIIDPIAFSFPSFPVLEKNSELEGSQRIFEGALQGAESFAVDGAGYIYTGLNDGRVVRFKPDEHSTNLTYELVARTGQDLPDCGKLELEHLCGRPLGMRFAPLTGELLIADAYFGLLALDVGTGKLRTLVTTVDSQPLVFANDFDFDVAHKEIIYLTDSSSKFQRRRVIYEMLESRALGRLVRVNLTSLETHTLAAGLPFPNGVTVSTDGTRVFFASTTRACIYQYHLEGPRSGTVSTLVDDLPGTMDNIRRNPGGNIWVALGSKRAKPFAFTQFTAGRPWIRLLVSRIMKPSWVLALIPSYGMILEVDDEGKILRNLQDPTGYLPWISEVEEKGNCLYMGSWRNPFIARKCFNDVRNHGLPAAKTRQAGRFMHEHKWMAVPYGDPAKHVFARRLPGDRSDTVEVGNATRRLPLINRHVTASR
eukprot:jgi/Mesvir1/17610/Mv08837-RA.1